MSFQCSGRVKLATQSQVETANLSQTEIANNPDWYVRFLQSRRLGGIRSLHSTGLQGNGFQFLAPEALALNVEYRGIIKDPVQGTEQGVVLIEIAAPVGRVLVAGEHNIKDLKEKVMAFSI